MLQLKNLSENLQRNLLNILPVTDVQYSLQLADTVGAKENCPLIGGVRLLKSFLISVLISRIKHFPIFIRCSWVD